MQAEPVARAQRHIIDRPRLLDLLDEHAAQARIILLIAPAGYGKTTLARQWLATRNVPHGWHAARWASVDPVEVALALATAAESILPGAAATLQRCVRGSRQILPQRVADALLGVLQPWPHDAWLVLDDYHLAAAVPETRELLDRLAHASALRLLVTSRCPPAWLTSRDLVYGAARVIDEDALRFSTAEARRVLSSTATDEAERVVALAGGWPAVVGLAAIAAADVSPPGDPSSLYNFFADELLATLPREFHLPLAQIALVPEPDTALTAELLGVARTPQVLTAAAAAGIITISHNTIFLHPLLRDFLIRRELRPRRRSVQIAAATVTALLRHRRWDASFSIIRDYHLSEFFDTLFSNTIDEMIGAGRTATLRNWLSAADKCGVRSAISDAVRAELASLAGQHRDAHAAARSALLSLPATHRLSARLRCLDGRSLRFLGQAAEAIPLYSDALRLARSPADRREAAWGRFNCAQDVEDPDLQTYAAEYAKLPRQTLDDTLRSETMRLVLPLFNGGMTTALRDGHEFTDENLRHADPFVVCAYLKQRAYALLVNAHYQESLLAADAASNVARAADFGFALAHIDHVRAGALAGLRRFAQASRVLRTAATRAAVVEDLNLRANIETTAIRLTLSEGNPAAGSAYDLTEIETWNHSTKVELIATSALAHAAAGTTEQAEALLAHLSAGRMVESQVTILAARAVLAQAYQDRNARETAVELWRLAATTGAYDPLVQACRAVPVLISALHEVPELRRIAQETFTRSCDVDLARATGLQAVVRRRDAHVSPSSRLTARERDVLDLVTRGKTNAQIGRLLFIEEVTVKAHLRNILAKLGVRSRTEAALLYRDSPSDA